MSDLRAYDVVIVGGGVAGLGAATALARSLRRVLVVDAGEPRNGVSDGAHNVLGHEGIAPLELLATGRCEAESYGAEIRNDRAVCVRRTDSGFDMDLAAGGTVQARRILIATGLVDELPNIPGVRALWGKSVLHCAYCHGWEVRGRRIGVLATSPFSGHQGLLFRQLSDDVTVFLGGTPELPPEAQEQLAALDVRMVVGPVDRLRIEDGVLQAVVLADGSDVAVDAVVVAPRFVARAELYEQLGGTPTEHPMGTFIATDQRGQTDVPGVWAAGNSSDLSAMVSVAAGAGVMAGAGINADLVAEDAGAAARKRRDG